MAKQTVTQLASLFQDFGKKSQELDHLLIEAFNINRYLQATFRDISDSVQKNKTDIKS